MTARRSEPSPIAIVLQIHSFLPGVLSEYALSKRYRRASERTPGRTVWVWRTIAFGDGSDRRAVIVVKRSPRPSENASILVSYIDKKKAKKIRGSATFKALAKVKT